MNRAIRELNKEQKELLDSYFEKNKEKLGMDFRLKDLPYELYEELEEINSFKTMYSCITNYILDKVWNN